MYRVDPQGVMEAETLPLLRKWEVVRIRTGEPFGEFLFRVQWKCGRRGGNAWSLKGSVPFVGFEKVRARLWCKATSGECFLGIDCRELAKREALRAAPIRRQRTEQPKPLLVAAVSG
ncbi:hypothetical protein HY933_02015 [Candidatus Falkowbacteria bacterium]|nr:hypothetical protein [Candidatus Falkowbacteria bacterium]